MAAPSEALAKEGGAGGSCTRAGRIKSPLCCCYTTAPWKMERSEGVAPSTSDWRSDALLLRHERMGN